MNKNDEKCICEVGDKIVMACSGASDVGLISDRVARSLQIGGQRKMNCLAVVGAGIEKSIENFRTKDLLVIDGCPVACGKKIMEKQGIENYKYLVVTEHGLEKGQSPASEENIRIIYDQAIQL